MARLVRCSGTVAAAFLTLCGCSDKPPGGGGGGAPVGQVEAAFDKAGASAGIPVRFMIAAGYLESRLSADNASANYLQVDSGDQKVPRGTIMTQTAFGISLSTLGLDPAKQESGVLETQIAAYATWLQGQIKAAGATLNPNPETQEDKFYWIETLANLHRQGMSQRSNIRILFARELIGILNQGFVWQDPRNGQQLTLEKEATPIDPAKFDEDGQKWFSELNYLTDSNQVPEAVYLPLTNVPSDGQFQNKPTHVEVIHCPLTLSGCLELQNRSGESDIHLAAHYIIPPITMDSDTPGATPPDPALNRILQVAEHKDALVLTDDEGNSNPVEDAVIVMLVGNSGRIVDGARTPADPTWFTDMQLRAMGQLINDICTLLAQNDQTVNRDDCMSTSSDNGVQFRYQQGSEEFRWGDIADFDQNVYDSYVANPGGLSTAVAFQFAQGDHQFKAGDPMQLTALFDSTAIEVDLEKLVRCPDHRVVWQVDQREPMNGQNRYVFAERAFDSGPNSNGTQYFRIRVYGKDGHLMGWAIDDAFLSDFTAAQALVGDDTCSDGA